MATATVTGSATTNAAPAELSSTQIRKRSALGERRRSLRAGDGLRVCVVGLGYIGLPTASILGTKGCRVFGVDVSPQVVDTINAGRIHIEEPDLDLIVKAAVQAGNLTAATVPSEADVFVLAVPTPIQPDKQPDVSMVEAAARAIAPFVRKGNLVILESTSPVGTTDGVVARVLREAGHVIGEDVYVAYCPERVLPGRILTELIENDRVVGGVDDASTEVALEFYQGFVRGEVVGTDSRTAEMVKLSENSYRDVNIAYANELSMVCDRAGISVWEVIRIANRHPRVKILQPGPGVGGHCIAVDPWFIVAGDPQNAKVIRAAREVNDRKPHWVIDKVEQCASRVVDPVIACLGLSFKADVDDLRESPAVEIVHELKRRNLGELLVVEPHLLFHPDFELVKLEEAVRRANIVLVLVDHKPFKRLRRDALNEKILIDTRGLFL